MFGNVRLVFGTILENLRKSSGNGRKSSENRQKRRYQYVYIIKRTLHVSSKIWILCYSWQEQYLTRSLRSLVRYCSCHSNIKFISSRHRVISSMYLLFSSFIQFSATEIQKVFSHAKLVLSTLQWLEKRWGAHARWWATAIFQLTERHIKANSPCFQ